MDGAARGGHVLKNLTSQLRAHGPLDLSAAACGATSSARLPGMGMWFDIMRDMEHLMDDYANIFDAWQAGGVDGMVIGPLVFNSPDLIKIPEPPGHLSVPKDVPPALAFDPNPAVYEQFGVEVPPKVAGAPYSSDKGGTGIQMTADVDHDARALLTEMLTDAKRRGFRIMIFQAQTGAGASPDAGDSHWAFDEGGMQASCARIVDTLQQFPMADGWVMDGPEWGYEISAGHQDHRSYFFHDLPETLRVTPSVLVVYP
jgi:hypothetical protein